MNTRTGGALLAFAIPALLSAWCATPVFNSILIGLHPQIAPGIQTFPIFGMVFFGLTAIVLPLVIMLRGQNGD